MKIMSKKSGLGKFLVGLGIGAGLGILLAPKSGKETRRELKEKLDELVKKVKDIDVNEVKDEFMNKIEDIRNEIEDLDKEKVLKIAKEKGKQLKQKAEELVDLAKEKGTPVLEDAADSVRKQAIKVTKNVLNKLEESE